MELRAEQIDAVRVVSIVAPALDANNVKEFKSAISGHLQGTKQLLLDLSELEFVDSSGLGAFLSCLRQLQAAGGDLKIFGVSKPVRTLFELVRMHRLLDIFNTRDEALRSYR